jgi:hypothetical protein
MELSVSKSFRHLRHHWRLIVLLDSLPNFSIDINQKQQVRAQEKVAA